MNVPLEPEAFTMQIPAGTRSDHARGAAAVESAGALGPMAGEQRASRPRVREDQSHAARAGVRPDGYHELRTDFQSLALHDTLTFERRAARSRSRATIRRVPSDETNLVWRAAEAVWRAAGGASAPR